MLSRHAPFQSHMRLNAFIAGIALLMTHCVSRQQQNTVDRIHQREHHAITGSQLVERTQGMTPEEREQVIVRELNSGNIPNFLRHLKPVHTTYEHADGDTLNATFWVMPDYLAVGSDDDFIRVPVTANTAQLIADVFGFTLPTTKMVDLIYQQANTKLTPQPMPTSERMQSIGYIFSHQLKIEGQLSNVPRTDLIAGHKKDVVLTTKLKDTSNKIATYGWHTSNDEVLQPLYLHDVKSPLDYSHGVRLVSSIMSVNGEDRLVSQVLQNWRLAPLISAEGALFHTRVPSVAN